MQYVLLVAGDGRVRAASTGAEGTAGTGQPAEEAATSGAGIAEGGGEAEDAA